MGTAVDESGNLVWDMLAVPGTEGIGMADFAGEEEGRGPADRGIVLGVVVDRDSSTVAVDIVVAFLGVVG